MIKECKTTILLYIDSDIIKKNVCLKLKILNIFTHLVHVVLVNVFAAFSLFALSEYGISITNLMFHYTCATDFADYAFMVGIPSQSASSQPQNSHKEKAT